MIQENNFKSYYAKAVIDYPRQIPDNIEGTGNIEIDKISTLDYVLWKLDFINFK